MKRKMIIFFLIFALVFLAGCDKSKADKIRLATDPTAEEFVIAEMLKAIVENKTDLEVEITKGIAGGTGNIHPAMIKKNFDMYPEYTGTAWKYVLKRNDLPNDNKLFLELKKEYKEKFDFEWVGLYGFNNSYGLMIREDIAEKYQINTYSDLAKYPDQFILGAEYDFFEREDGYEGLCNAYGIKFRKYVDMNFALKYDALKTNDVDVIVIFTTDGKLSSASGRVLRDDKIFFPKYLCGTVIRGEVLEKYPQLKEPLMLMEGLINDQEMSQLNYKTEVTNMDEKEVALEYLKSKGLLK